MRVSNYVSQSPPSFGHFDDAPFVRREVVTALRSICPVLRGDLVLDVGGGSGRHASWLAELTKARVELLDPWPRTHSSPIRVVKEFAEDRQPSLRHRYDIAYSVSVAHHFANRCLAFRNIRDYVKRGPYVIITASRADLLARPLNRFFPESLRIDLARYPTIQSLKSELIAAGFKDVTVEPLNLGRIRFDNNLLAFCKAKAWSALRLLARPSYISGLVRLETALLRAADHPIQYWPQRRTAILAHCESS